LPSQNKELANVEHSGLDEISWWQLSVERVVTSVTWDWERHKLTTVHFYFTDFTQFAMYTAATLLNLFDFVDPNNKDWTNSKKTDRGQVKFKYLKGSSPSEELWLQSPEIRNVM